MTRYRQLRHVEEGRILRPRLRWCAGYGCKLRGFMLRRQITPDEGLVLVHTVDNRLGSAVHMLFVFCALGIIWLDGGGAVVDQVVARPWRPAYVPRQPARYVLELHPSYVAQLPIGNHVQFVDA